MYLVNAPPYSLPPIYKSSCTTLLYHTVIHIQCTTLLYSKCTTLLYHTVVHISMYHTFIYFIFIIYKTLQDFTLFTLLTRFYFISKNVISFTKFNPSQIYMIPNRLTVIFIITKIPTSTINTISLFHTQVSPCNIS